MRVHLPEEVARCLPACLRFYCTFNQLLKMMEIADKSISFDDENDLVEFIASGMQNQGLDLMNEIDLDKYLNTKFM
jgi:hypothetical protein